MSIKDLPPQTVHLAATATVATSKAGRYLKALCNHFARKITATYDDMNGRIEFSFGHCEMYAEADALHIMVKAKNETMLARTKDVIADHLVRFGNKEELSVVWVNDET